MCNISTVIKNLGNLFAINQFNRRFKKIEVLETHEGCIETYARQAFFKKAASKLYN